MNRDLYSFIEKNYIIEKQINSKVFIVYTKSRSQKYVKKIYDYSYDLYNILKIIQLEKLENCIRIHLIEEHQDINKIFILEEYNELGNLQNIIEQNNIFPIDWIIKCLIDIVKGLNSLSKYQYMHRDIKPQNIVFDGKSFKLIDFETSKCYDQDLQKYQSSLGTKTCIAPEVQLLLQYSSKCDIWSVGCILYYILYKQYPLQNYDRQSLLQYYYSNQQLQFPSIFNKDLGDLLQQMLKTQEIDRVSLNSLYFQLKMINCLIKFNIEHPEENLNSIIQRIKLIIQQENDREICMKIYKCFKAVIKVKGNQKPKENQYIQRNQAYVQQIVREFENEKIYLDLIKEINQYIQE